MKAIARPTDGYSNLVVLHIDHTLYEKSFDMLCKGLGLSVNVKKDVTVAALTLFGCIAPDLGRLRKLTVIVLPSGTNPFDMVYTLRCSNEVLNQGGGCLSDQTTGRQPVEHVNLAGGLRGFGRFRAVLLGFDPRSRYI